MRNKTKAAVTINRLGEKQGEAGGETGDFWGSHGSQGGTERRGDATSPPPLPSFRRQIMSTLWSWRFNFFFIFPLMTTSTRLEQTMINLIFEVTDLDSIIKLKGWFRFQLNTFFSATLQDYRHHPTLLISGFILLDGCGGSRPLSAACEDFPNQNSASER